MLGVTDYTDGKVSVVAPDPAISDVKLILSSGAAEILKLDT